MSVEIQSAKEEAAIHLDNGNWDTAVASLEQLVALTVMLQIRGLLEELRLEVQKERLPFGAGTRVDALLARVAERYRVRP